MESNRSSGADVCSTDEDIPSSASAQEQMRQSSEHGSVFDSEDDLSLGTDAQAFAVSGPPQLFSPESSSISTGYLYESSNESIGDRGSHRVIKKLAYAGRQASSDSLLSDFSDFSRTSQDVSSLLNAMTVDPEEFLANLGFAEPDMRTRIPDRFLQSPSKAHGVDVDLFRRSLDQDDLYGSTSQDSPLCSDPGSSRIPLRFITPRTEPINTVLSRDYSSVPLIYEPEEAPEDSFDLMRHLRLNKPSHVTKGMFLEPVTEELEVSSVGSGTVRTKISRKLSNEEGTIVREESLEQPNMESELVLNVPVMDDVEKSLDSKEFEETKVAVQIEDDSQVIVNLEADEGMNAVIEAKSSGDAVNLKNNTTEILQSETSITDYNNTNFISGDLATKVDEEVSESFPDVRNPVHLRVASIVVQDSFELEEITNEDFNEKESSCSTDQDSGLHIKSSEKQRLTRENSGESSGFEEMLPDKESLTPNSSSPPLISKRLSTDAHVIVSDSHRPLAALLDPEMFSLAREGEQFVEEKSPRAAFAQRRTRSLTKQRPIDEDTLASLSYSPSSFASKDLADNDGRLGTKISQDTYTGDLGPSFLACRAKEPAIDLPYSSLDSYVCATDVNYNRTLKFEREKPEFKKSDNTFYNQDVAPGENFENELQNNEDIVITQSECSSRFKTEAALRGEESISHLNAKTTGILKQNITENKEDVHRKTDDNFPRHGSENVIGEETPLSRDLAAGESDPLMSTRADGACAEVKDMDKSQKALRMVDSEYQQHYLHEINVLEQSIQKYESTLSSGGPLDALRCTHTKHMLARITEEMNAIQELRLMISSELERMKHLLAERRDMLLSRAVRDPPLGSEVSQKMADLLREQSSLNMGLSKISDELSIGKKASRRARIFFHIENAKKELKDEREKCVREFREEIKEALVRELSEKFSSEIELLRLEVRSKDAVIEQLKKNQEGAIGEEPGGGQTGEVEIEKSATNESES